MTRPFDPSTADRRNSPEEASNLRETGQVPSSPSPAELSGTTHAHLRAAASEGGHLPSADAPTLADGGGQGTLPTAIPDDLLDHPRYKIVGLLGGGGMGAVFRAEHRLMDRQVALKVIRRDLVLRAGAVERFRREVQAAARLHHPNIVTAFDAEQAGGTHFLVMEYVPGRSLREIVHKDGPLPAKEAIACIRQAALALQHAHDLGMVHRDIKPDNLMRTEQGTIKILDFGLARLAQAESEAAPFESGPGTETTGSLTLPGAMMGTPDYVAPEQIQDSRMADGRADIYSLGCTFFFLLTGQPPFAGGTSREKLRRQVEEEAPDPTRVRAGISPGLSAIVRRMMTKNPDQRYGSPAEVVEALDRLQRRRRLPWIVGIPLLSLLVLGLAGFLGRPDATPPAVEPPPPFRPLPVPAPAELAGRDNAADGLRGDGIDPQTLDLLGLGRETPPELVAVFGDLRFGLEPLAGFPAFSPDGKEVASPTQQEVRVFDRANGKLLRRLTGYPRTTTVLYSPDGTLLAGVGHQQQVVVWDARTGKTVHEWTLRSRAMTWGLAFHPQGKLLAASSHGGPVRLFDLQSGKPGRVLPHPQAVSGIAFHPSGELLATACADGQVRLLDLNGRVVRSLFAQDFKTASTYLVCAFSPDGSLLAVGSDNLVQVWEYHHEGAGLKRLWVLPQQGAGLLAFAPDGKELHVTGHAYGNERPAHVLFRLEARTGLRLGSFTAVDKGGYASYALSPDGKTIAGSNVYAAQRLHLYDAATGALLNPARGHDRPVEGLRFSADGRLLASASKDRRLLLWNLADGKVQQELQGHEDWITDLDADARGRFATAGWDRTLRVWGADGALEAILQGPPFEKVAFVPDSPLLLGGCIDGTLHLFDAAARIEKHVVRAHTRAVDALVVRPTGRHVASTSPEGGIRIFTLPGLEEVRNLPAHAPGFERRGTEGALAASPDGTLLYAAGDDGLVRSWNWEDARPAGLLSGPNHSLNAVAVAPHGRLVAAAGRDRRIWLWDPAQAKGRYLPVGQRDVLSLAFSPEARYLAAGLEDGLILLFRLAAKGTVPEDTGRAPDLVVLGAYDRHAHTHIARVDVDPTSGVVRSTGQDQSVRFWNPADFEDTQRPLTHPAPVLDLVAAGDGRRLWTIAQDRKLRLWDPLAPRIEKEIVCDTGRALARGGNRLLVGRADGVMEVWEAPALDAVKDLPRQPGAIWYVAATPDGKFGFAGHEQGQLHWWDLEKGRLLRTLRQPRRLEGQALAVSPDGKLLAFGGGDGSIRVWNLSQEKEERLLDHGGSWVRGLAFSSDSRYVLAGDFTEGLLSLHDLKTGRRLARIATAPIVSLAFLPDGRRAAVSHIDGKVRIWDLRVVAGK